MYNLVVNNFTANRHHGYANAHYDELAFWDKRLETNRTVDETLFFKVNVQMGLCFFQIVTITIYYTTVSCV